MAKKRGGKLIFAFIAVMAVAIAGASMNGTKKTTGGASNTVAPTAVVTATPRPATVRPSAVVSCVKSAGFSPIIADDRGGLRCDYTVLSTRRASITWTDGAQSYTVTGEPAALSRLYVDMLALEAWQSCAYSIKKHAVTGYGSGTGANETCATLKAYTAQIRDALDVKPTPAPTPIRYEYVLNKDSKVFHWPSCHLGAKIKKKNRKVLTRTREEMIKNGYKPCEVCGP